MVNAAAAAAAAAAGGSSPLAPLVSLVELNLTDNDIASVAALTPLKQGTSPLHPHAAVKSPP